MCDFILKLNEERRKNNVINSPFLDTSKIEDIQEINISSDNTELNTTGIKDKSKLFSKCFDNFSTQSSSINETNKKNTTPHLFNQLKIDTPTLTDIQETDIKNECTLTLDSVLVKLKESLIELEQVSKESSEANLGQYCSELMSIYSNLSNIHSKDESIVNPIEEKSNKTEHDLLLNKMTSVVSRLSEKSHELQNIKTKLDNHYKNESFSYSTSKEIKEKIRIFGKKFYEVFKLIQKDLNTEVKNEYWNLIQFSKDTTDYVLFGEKVKSLADNYNTYLSQVNTKLNDMFSNSSNI